METKHVSHVILYAKNFYRHTNDIVKDMQSIMQLDGHPFYTIDTPEKVVDVMKSDFLKWINSIEDQDIREFYLPWADGSVRWADGAEARIYNMLIPYNGSLIPMDSIALDYPKYDKFHLPQFNLVEQLFTKNMSFDEMNAKAKSILDETHEDRMDRNMNNLIDSYNWENLIKAVKISYNEDLSEKELQDELWDLYSDFMEQNVDADTRIVKDGRYQLYSKHFMLNIDTRYRTISIECNLVCHKSKEYKIVGDSHFHIDNIKTLFDMAIADKENIEASCSIANKINDEVEQVFSEYATNIVEAINCHLNIFNTIPRFNTKEFEVNKGGDYNTGGHEYKIDYNADTHEYALTISLIEFFKCSIEEPNLMYNSTFAYGEKL